MCFLGFGCSSHVTTTTNITNTVVNEDDLNNTTKTLMEASVNVLLKNANQCKSSVNQNNSCTLNKVKAAGPVKIGGKQSNEASVNFSCIQSTKASSDMATAMIQKVGAELNATNGVNLANSANSAAENLTKSGFMGGADSSTADNTNITNESLTVVKQNIENIFSRNLNNNFSSETVNECIGITNQKNTVAGEDIISGESVVADCESTNSVQQVSKCEQLSSAINKTLSETAQELGFTISSKSATELQNEAKSEIKSETIGTGPIQDLGNAASSVINSIGNIVGMGVAGFGIFCCCIFCCILLSCVASYMSTKSSSTGSISSSGLNTGSTIQSGGELFDLSYSLISDIILSTSEF
jgi:hypothetical protein